MPTIDLNADLGESFGPWPMGNDEAMMDIVTSANIACGGHAGDSNTMLESVSTASARAVTVGAHPGFKDKEGFGRRRIPLTGAQLQTLVAEQVGALKGVAGLAGQQVKYIKPHGALGNWAAENTDVASAIATSIKCAHADCAVLAISGTALDVQSKKAGLETYSEIFADRGYGDDANLVPRSQPGAMISDPHEAGERLLRFIESGFMDTVSGGKVRLEAQSICIHGDSPHAVAMAVHIKEILTGQGITLKSFV